MVRIAPRARICYGCHDHLSLAVVVLPSAVIGDLDLATAIRGRISAALPGGRERNNSVRFGVYLATGTGNAILLVESRNAIVINTLVKDIIDRSRLGQWLGQGGCECCRSQNGTDNDSVEADHFQVFQKY